uniref:phage major tropism determinant n=1 Tax=Vibrio cholerae TaxID=666 RepID=UPI003F589DB1
MFLKSIGSEPAFLASASSISAAFDIIVAVGGSILSFSSSDSVSLPSLISGTDYAIYATADGLIASDNFTVPSGYTESNSRRIGGFHYQDAFINSQSVWDLKYKPSCSDPRGMARTIGGFWADIYLLNATPDVLGTSAYNATIADGASPPKIPAKWGGNGTSKYANFTQYIATEVLAAFGKRLPNAHEFSVLAQGSVTGHVASVDPVTTKFDASARSLIGCEQVSGHMWQWGSEQWDRGNGSSGYAWYAAETNGKGSVYSALGSEGVGASVFGSHWGGSGRAGSRCSYWDVEPWHSSGSLAARGVCDHLQLG